MESNNTMDTRHPITDALSRLRQWSLSVATAAAAYVVVPCFMLYRTKQGKYRVRPHSDIKERGLFEQVHPGLHPAPVVGLRNCLAPNKRGARPDIPECVLDAFVEAGAVAFRGKHLVWTKGYGDNPSPFSVIAQTFTSFKAGVGYVPSLFSAYHAGMVWGGVPYAVDFVRGADGEPAGSDGGGVYICDENSPVWQALRGKSGQVRIYDPEKGIFAKGMLSPADKSCLPPGINAWIIIDPSMFKAGGPVSVPEDSGLIDRGMKEFYSSRKDFFVDACNLGIRDLYGNCALGVMRVKKAGRTSLTPGALVRLDVKAAPLAKELLERNFSKWLQGGGIANTIGNLIEQERQSGLAELRNVSAIYTMANEMFKEKGIDLRVDPLAVKLVRDQVLDNVGRKFYRFATGCGVKGTNLVGRIDNSIPYGVAILPPGPWRHGEEVVVWRQPIVTSTGVGNLTAWVLSDPNCPSDIREKYGYLEGCDEFIANELVITVQFVGDNDGDDFGVSGDPLLVKMFSKHARYIFEPGELFLIEGSKERGLRSKTKIQDSKVGLGQDKRGPIGIQTNISLAGWSLSRERVIRSMMRAMQTSVDQQKKDLPNPDYAADADREAWKRVEIPGHPGQYAWQPSNAILPEDLEDGSEYPDIGKLLKWVKAELGSTLRDAMPWNKRSKKLSPQDLKREPITPEVCLVDIVYNHFLTLVKESGVDLSATGEMLEGNDLLEILEWKTGKNFSVSAADPKSAWYRALIATSGLQKYESSKKQILEMYKSPQSSDARDRNYQLAAAKEQLISSLSELTVEERLVIFITECKVGNHERAYRTVLLGDNEITKLLGLEDLGGCSFMDDNSAEFLKRVAEAMEAPHEELLLHRFGDAGVAVLSGYEYRREGDQINRRHDAETLNSRHAELFGAPLLECDVCKKRARKLLINRYRWTPPGSMGDFVISKTSEINGILGTSEMQEKIRRILAPHYEEKKW